MTDKSYGNIWFCGIPGSKWSGIDIHMRQILPCDRSDETPDRVFYHRAHSPQDTNNGHRGSYWGPGMGCGEDWYDFNHLDKAKIERDINNVFSGDGYRVIKNHFLARRFNLDYVWNNFSGDYIVLIYREPQKSFAWWSEVMDFSEGHFPDYRPGYTDYNTMRTLLWEESAKITDFAIRKEMNFIPYDRLVFKDLKGFNLNAVNKLAINTSDVYIAITRIP